MVNSEGLANTGVQMMNAEETKLYERIQAFSLDKPDVQLSFSKRLARDNGWSLQYARQAIEEYKKFAFLAIASGHPVTPSDQVDQVWHLHLTYTRSYWEEFCSQVLQTSLHHDPTLGGEAENQKFDDWYSRTLESYERFFGVKPPAEIWSAPKDRFGRDLYFVRINTQQNWILSKLQVQKKVTISIAILFTLILSVFYISNSENNINPLAGALIVVFCIATAFGFIQFLLGIGSLMKNLSFRPTIGVFGGSGCGSPSCGGWNSGWGDSSGHSSGDSGDSGCGGGGCGGCGACGG
ncbi:hypothetical protein Syn7502_01625 [Synechococcus sp. PCC 7502]|uniref:glycine-rich domain-containing protein n=1 Tax=Synechococcus sp. PCC 7502 TaxID=1173263 RepID=UPI00029F8C00|nr:hypothetical protein [Synechococcus sp. PCC 7502]AFY73681.1 hypothetical protein Syn7502_01625 [Synechococcus sp. PCC 7502]